MEAAKLLLASESAGEIPEVATNRSLKENLPKLVDTALQQSHTAERMWKAWQHLYCENYASELHSQGLLFADCVPEEQTGDDADQEEEEEEEEEPEVWEEPWSDLAAAAAAAAAAAPEQLDKEPEEEAQQQQQQPPPEQSSRSKLARLLALRIVYGKQPPQRRQWLHWADRSNRKAFATAEQLRQWLHGPDRRSGAFGDAKQNR